MCDFVVTIMVLLYHYKGFEISFAKVGNNATSLPLHEFFSSSFIQLNESINLIL
jgi:hypothetical protein